MRTIRELDDAQTLARTLWGEARGETIVGRVAVACVIINRFLSDKWFSADTIKEVCLKEKQFSCWNERDPNRDKCLKIENRDYIFVECLTIAKLAEMRALHDMVDGATHYHAKHVRPIWARGKKPVTTIGQHVFYNNID